MKTEQLRHHIGNNITTELERFFGEEGLLGILARWSLPTRAKTSKALSVLHKKLIEAEHCKINIKNSTEETYCVGVYYGIYACYVATNNLTMTFEETISKIEALSKDKDFSYPLIHLTKEVAQYGMPYNDTVLNKRCIEGYVKGLSEGKTIIWCCFKHIFFIELLLRSIVMVLLPLPEPEYFTG